MSARDLFQHETKKLQILGFLLQAMNGLHDGLGGMDHQPVVNGFADEEVILQNASSGHFELISLQYVIFQAFL